MEGLFGADYSGDGLSTQGEAVVKGVAAVEDKPSGMTLDVDYLQELIAIQEDCPKEIGFFGTRNMGFMHQQLIEILAYALCLTGNHIYTSGATGTNAAVIRGALRAEQPELLTVVLPQSLAKQPRESRELLEGVAQIVEAPENDGMPLVEASRICNDTIVSKVKQIIVFAFHDSRLLLETCRNAENYAKARHVVLSGLTLACISVHVIISGANNSSANSSPNFILRRSSPTRVEARRSEVEARSPPLPSRPTPTHSPTGSRCLARRLNDP